ncbi:hypothetical protein CSPX01_09850 [Colletotrichum filicis]|nr:hypothetical protein CSPX01_09850 [Colletotrichum filicis]
MSRRVSLTASALFVITIGIKILALGIGSGNVEGSPIVTRMMLI